MFGIAKPFSVVICLRPCWLLDAATIEMSFVGQILHCHHLVFAFYDVLRLVYELLGNDESPNLVG